MSDKENAAATPLQPTVMRGGRHDNSPSFLCGLCKQVICTDCQQIAEEYQELYENQKRTLFEYEARLKKAEEEAAKERSRAEDLDAVLRCGIHAQMLAWMDSLSPSQLREAVEARASNLTPG